MTFKPLTQEQYQRAKQSFTDQQIMEMEQKRKQSFQPEQPKERGFIESLVKRPVERLALEPMRRTIEAIASSLPMVPKELRDRALDLSTQDLSIDFPLLGTFETRGLSGGLKQIGGETLETAAWLYSPAKVPSAIRAGIAQTGIRAGIKESAKVGAKAGFVGGGLFGTGEAMQEGEDTQEILKRGAMGAGVGLVAGGTLGAGLSTLPIITKESIKQARNGYQLGESFAKTIFQKGKPIIEKAGVIPKRIVTRTAEDIAEFGAKQKAIAKAPKHIGEAMKQGIEDPVIEFIKIGTKAEKIQRAEMMNIAQVGVKDLTKLDSVKRLPGQTILNGPVDFLIKNAEKGTKQTEKVLNSLPKTTQNFKGLYEKIVKDFKRIGLSIKDGQIIRERGSRVPDSDLPFYNQIIREFTPDNKGNVPLTYKGLDALRDRWYQAVKVDKTFTQGVKGKTGYLSKIRAMMTDEIDNVAGGSYRKAQQQTAESLQSLSEFVRLIGYKGDLKNISKKDLKVGETFIRVFGNAADRPKSTIDTIYDVARRYGYKGQENPINQLKFADMLESVYGQPTRSIGQQLARAVSPTSDPTQVTASAIREMVKWSPYSGIIRFLRARGLLGRHEKDVLRAFENLVRGEAGLSLSKRMVMPLEKSVASITSDVKTGIQKIKEMIK